MKKYLWIIAFWLLSNLSLGQTPTDYLAEFKWYAQQYGINLSYRVEPKFVISNTTLTLKGTNGYYKAAAYTDHDLKTIFFDTRTNSYRYNLKVLVYHELGHYYLHRNHKNGYYEDTGEPISIMGTYLEIEWDYIDEETKKNYLDELFNN